MAASSRGSRGFYEAALVTIGKGFYGLAAFNLERALELHLKAAEPGVGYTRTCSESKDLFLKYSVELGGARRSPHHAQALLRGCARGARISSTTDCALLSNPQ
ncbi:MAG: hypothetical protein ACP5KA_07630 [Desulfurococcaceae archaeon]